MIRIYQKINLKDLYIQLGFFLLIFTNQNLRKQICQFFHFHQFNNNRSEIYIYVHIIIYYNP